MITVISWHLPQLNRESSREFIYCCDDCNLIHFVVTTVLPLASIKYGGGGGGGRLGLLLLNQH